MLLGKVPVTRSPTACACACVVGRSAVSSPSPDEPAIRSRVTEPRKICEMTSPANPSGLSPSVAAAMLTNFVEGPPRDGYFAVLGVIALGCGSLFANFKRMGWYDAVAGKGLREGARSGTLAIP